jgi:hypothetical protein
MTSLGKLLQDAITMRTIHEEVRDQLRSGVMQITVNGTRLDPEESAKQYEAYIESDNRMIETISELID